MTAVAPAPGRRAGGSRLRKALMGTTARTYSPLTSVLLVLPLVLLLFGAFMLPLLRLLATSVWDGGFTLEHFDRMLTTPLYLKILLRTLRAGFIVTVVTLLLGYPVAYLMARLRGWKLTVVGALVVVSLWTSILVRSYAWTVLLQRNGLVNSALLATGLIDQPLDLLYTEGAVVLGMTHVLLPYMILPIYATLRGIPRDLSLAAQNLGAGPFATFRRVVLPLSLPGVAAGLVLVFIFSLGFFITPALLGGPRTLFMATLISHQVVDTLDWPFAAALATALLTITLALVAVFNRVLRLERVVTGR